MADLTFVGKNNQKKTKSLFASAEITTAVAMNETLFTLPPQSVVTNAYAIVTTVSGTATDTVDIKVGATVVANEVVVGVLGIQGGTLAKAYFPTGGQVTVVAGADVPGITGKIRIVVEYDEIEVTNGKYTN